MCVCCQCCWFCRRRRRPSWRSSMIRECFIHTPTFNLCFITILLRKSLKLYIFIYIHIYYTALSGTLFWLVSVLFLNNRRIVFKASWRREQPTTSGSSKYVDIYFIFNLFYQVLHVTVLCCIWSVCSSTPPGVPSVNSWILFGIRSDQN